MLVSARVLDGVAVAAAIREELKPGVEAFAARAGRPPGLGIVLVGSHAPSEIYVRNKLKAASDIGCRADLVRLPESATLAEALKAVADLNASPVHDAILVQDPLPDTMGAGAAQAVFDSIDPAKDVDGFTPVNAGRLVQNRAPLAPCTPSGVIELLRRSGIPMAGAHAVVIGRSDIVGKPIAALLTARDATVTICHSKTRDLAAVCREADILIAAIGRPGFVTREFVKPGAAVIDVGINRLDSLNLDAAPEGLRRSRRIRAALEQKGKILVGDVDFDDVAAVAGWLTPVPGGIGPLTVAKLLENTLMAARLRRI